MVMANGAVIADCAQLYTAAMYSFCTTQLVKKNNNKLKNKGCLNAFILVQWCAQSAFTITMYFHTGIAVITRRM